MTAPSEAFLDWCQQYSKRNKQEYDQPLYLTSQTNESAREIGSNGRLKILQASLEGPTFKVSFVGSLNSNFNFDAVIEAAKRLPIEVFVAGDGPLFENLKSETSALENFHMLGWISNQEVEKLIKLSDLMVAPYKDLPDFNISIPNKFLDAWRYGTPILTSIGGITREIIIKEKVGEIYRLSNKYELARIIEKMLDSKPKIAEYSSNARTLYESRFTFEKVYGSFVDFLENAYRPKI